MPNLLHAFNPLPFYLGRGAADGGNLYHRLRGSKNKPTTAVWGEEKPGEREVALKMLKMFMQSCHGHDALCSHLHGDLSAEQRGCKRCRNGVVSLNAAHSLSAGVSK